MTKQDKKSTVSRRGFLGTTAMATAAFSMNFLDASGSDKAKSKNSPEWISELGGLQIGTVTYSFRTMKERGAQDILKYCIDSGLSSIELMGEAAELYAGIPIGPGADAANVKQNIGGKSMTWKFGFDDMTMGNSGGWGSLPGNEKVREWRKSVPMAKFEEVRKMYNDAGVDIHIFKVSPATWSDDEIDYAFRAGKALGAKALTDELDWVEGAVPRLASFAEKHGMYAAFHVHQQFGNKDFSADPYLAISPAVMLNFDAGHYYGATGLNPADYIRKYHARIFSVHIKDKTGPQTAPPNTNYPWGQGETPLKDVLLLMKEHAGEKDWPKYADIELEYPVQAWSNPVKEVRTCVNYIKQVLVCE